ncbi:MAG: 16S rRNA (adenine(1518)-N(6)/adenine(1519)-N(6))-dimethyltransferase RsmA [Acidobacteriota bacterium]
MGRQKLGQHFLVNRHIAQKIVKPLFSHNGNIFEIGPGKGILTELIVELKPGKHFIAVEKDPALYENLKRTLSNKVEFINSDILDIDPGQLFNKGQTYLVSNVPYNISKELIDWILTFNKYFPQGVLMVQKEFYLKMISEPASKEYNPRSILFNMIYNIKKIIEVKPGSFSPPPKVNSTVFIFEAKKDKMITGKISEDFYSFLKIIFHNRRKTLSNNLARSYSPEKIRSLLQSQNIPLNIRGEQLAGDILYNLFLHLNTDQ